MKYLENLQLENLTKSLNNCEIGGLIISGRVELYSTKKAGNDKKNSKILESKLEENNTIHSNGKTDLTAKTKKILVDLIQTLNASLPDYDFSLLSPDSFASIPLNESVQSINSHLAELTVQQPSFLTEMWSNIDEALGNLNNCEAYKLADNVFLDETENGMLWNFNYFFCNKEMRRLCYFNCMAYSKYRKLSVSHFMEEDSENEDYDVEMSVTSTQESEEEYGIH